MLKLSRTGLSTHVGDKTDPTLSIRTNNDVIVPFYE